MKTFVDIGACIGEFTDECLCAHPDCKVYAVEPFDLNYKFLLQKYAKEPRVELHNMAIGSKTQMGLLYLPRVKNKVDVGNKSCSIVKEKCELDFDNRQYVQVISITDFLAYAGIDHIDILKIDAEGVEYTILNELLDSGKHQSIDAFYFEEHDKQIPGERERGIAFQRKAEFYGIWHKFHKENDGPYPAMAPSNDVVLSCYFTSKPDPQVFLENGTEEYVKANDYDYMRIWAESLTKLNMKAVVFSDCSVDFYNRYIPKGISVIHQHLESDLSVNDERFLIFERYLLAHPEIDRILITDISDVEFKRNIFKMMSSTEGIVTVGSNDSWAEKPKIYQRLQQLVTAHRCNKMLPMPIYWAGTFGGNRATILELLAKTNEWIMHGKHIGMYNVNLLAFNYALYRMAPGIVTGHPFFSKLKAYEYVTTAAVRHK